MARRTADIKPFRFTGIERGLIRREGRKVRQERQALEEKRLEQEKLDRITQQGFQAVAAQQRQQQIDVQKQQVQANIVQQQQELQERQRRSVAEQKERISQNKISNTLAVANSMLKTPGITETTKDNILRTIAGEVDGVFDNVNLDFVDSGAVLNDVNQLWKDFSDGKLTKQQLFVATQVVANQYEKSAAAQQTAGAAQVLLTQEAALERTEAAAGVGEDKERVRNIGGRIQSISNRLNATLPDETFAIKDPKKREELQRRLEFFQDQLDFELAPELRPAPVAPTVAAPVAEPAAPEGPPLVKERTELPPWLQQRGEIKEQKGVAPRVQELQREQQQKFAEESRYFQTYVAANNGRIPDEKEFDAAFAEAKRRQQEKLAPQRIGERREEIKLTPTELKKQAEEKRALQ